MELIKAGKIAHKYLMELQSITERAEIAGSIRRRVSEVNDIEFVIIPRAIPVPDGFFYFTKEPSPEFVNWINKFERIRGDAYGRYTRRKLPEGIEAAIFIATPHNYGHILAIRTGPRMFSAGLMSKLKQNGYRSKDGYIYSRNGLVPVTEEKQIFRMIRREYIPPEFRV